MDAIGTATVTLPAAAHAAGMSVRALQTVMACKALPLLGQPDRAPGQRNRFAPVDVVRLAVARHLIAFGLTVAEAAHVLDRSVDLHVDAMLACGIDLPPVFLTSRLDGLAVHVSRTSAGGLHVATSPVDLPPRVTHPARIVLDVGAIIHEALDRLKTPSRAGIPAKGIL